MTPRHVLAIIGITLGAFVACGEKGEIRYKELLDEDPMVRADAARRLGEARAADAVGDLVAVLDDPSEDVRVMSLIALAQIADPAPVPALVEMVDDPLLTVRMQLSRTLGLIGDPRGIPALERLLYDPDETVRLSSARSLGWIGTPEAVQTLVNIALMDEAEFVRGVVVRVLGDQDLKDAIPLLEDAMLGESDHVRANAAYVLREMADESSLPSFIEALEDPFYKVRSLAAHAVGDIGPNNADGAEVLRERLKVESHEMVQVDLVWNLARCGDGSHLEVARRLLLRAGEEDVRAEAAKALGDVGDSSDIPLLEKAVNDKRGLVRREAHRAAEKLKEA